MLMRTDPFRDLDRLTQQLSTQTVATPSRLHRFDNFVRTTRLVGHRIRVS